jgi:hypothetical protein
VLVREVQLQEGGVADHFVLLWSGQLSHVSRLPLDPSHKPLVFACWYAASRRALFDAVSVVCAALRKVCVPSQCPWNLDFIMMGGVMGSCSSCSSMPAPAWQHRRLVMPAGTKQLALHTTA